MTSTKDVTGPRYPEMGKLVLIARQYLSQHYPTWAHALNGRIKVYETDRSWEVTASEIPDSCGGMVVVAIDKTDFRVIGVKHAVFEGAPVSTMPTSAASASTYPDIDELVVIAKNYLKKHHPEWVSDLSRGPVIITETEDGWEVTTAMPEGRQGGGPAVLIDKRTHSVRRAYHYQ